MAAMCPQVRHLCHETCILFDILELWSAPACCFLLSPYFSLGRAGEVQQFVLNRKEGTFAIKRTEYNNRNIWILAGAVENENHEKCQKIFYVNHENGNSIEPPMNNWVLAQDGVVPTPIVVFQKK